jgi:O-succinylbenzoic acid--CoA ligase
MAANTVVTAMSLPPTPDFVRRSAERFPDAPAVVAGDRVVTYGELDEATATTGGPAAGARVIPATSTVETVLELWRTWRSGSVALVHDPREELPGLDVAPAPGDHTWVPTSGSSGEPRVVRITAGNVVAAVAASRARLGNGPADRWLLALPLFHVGGLSILWRSAEAGGAVVLHDGFDVERVARAMSRGGVSMASLVPTMLHRVLEVLDEPVTGMRAVVVGGGAAGSSLLAAGLDAGLPVVATYGSTETCSQVATVAPGEMRRDMGTAGRPLDGFTVTIERSDAGGIGEILVSGAAVSPGYVGEAPRVGPFRSHDLGRIDEEGRLVVVGRSDDVIVTGGENVVPSVVEAALATHPSVDAVAVYGVLDEEWGEVVVATIVGDRRVVDTGELHTWARARLRRCEIPRRWFMVDALPMLPNGKVDRRALADR